MPTCRVAFEGHRTHKFELAVVVEDRTHSATNDTPSCKLRIHDVIHDDPRRRNQLDTCTTKRGFFWLAAAAVSLQIVCKYLYSITGV